MCGPPFSPANSARTAVRNGLPQHPWLKPLTDAANRSRMGSGYEIKVHNALSDQLADIIEHPGNAANERVLVGRKSTS